MHRSPGSAIPSLISLRHRRAKLGAAMLAGAALLLSGMHASANPLEAPPPSDGSPYPMTAGAYQVAVEPDVMVAMRDGVRLATDLYVPEGAATPLPSVLIRTPYNKLREDAGVQWARYFASHGYLVAVQDVRGKHKSEGTFTVMGSDAADGFDTIAWLAAHPRSNGRVGTFGCSYLGINQVLTAALRPPALKAMVANAAGGALGTLGGRAAYFGARRGGAFELAASLQWFPVAGAKRSEPANQKSEAPEAIEIAELAWRLPVADILPEAGLADTDWTDFAAREPGDPWWEQMGYISDASRADVPIMWVNSWYDYGVAQTFALREHFARTSLSAHARDNQPVIISPAEHCQSELLPEGAKVQGRAMGDPRFDYWTAYLRWFDRWLKTPTETAVTQEPAFRYFTMGDNQWRTAETWPVAGALATKLYLSATTRANSRAGDGTLSLQALPARTESFIYDPASPVPSVGGPFCCEGFPPSGTADPYDSRAVEMRDDVLVYTSAPLAADFEISGPVTLEMFVGSQAADTDLTAKLLVVEPDGRAIGLLETIQRARYRNGFDHAEALAPDRPNRLRLELGQTSNLFRRGERLRLEISSSSFPRFDRNLNPSSLSERTGVGPQAVINQVFTGGETPTRLEFFGAREPEFAVATQAAAGDARKK